MTSGPEYMGFQQGCWLWMTLSIKVRHWSGVFDFPSGNTQGYCFLNKRWITMTWRKKRSRFWRAISSANDFDFFLGPLTLQHHKRWKPERLGDAFTGLLSLSLYQSYTRTLGRTETTGKKYFWAVEGSGGLWDPSWGLRLLRI